MFKRACLILNRRPSLKSTVFQTERFSTLIIETVYTIFAKISI